MENKERSEMRGRLVDSTVAVYHRAAWARCYAEVMARLKDTPEALALLGGMTNPYN